METGKPEEIQATLRLAVKTIDKAVERGIIHRNAGARRKSRLMRRAYRALQGQSGN